MLQESLILKNLIHNEEYSRTVLPHLKEEYFQKDSDRTVFRIIENFTKEYNSLPSVDAISVAVNNTKMLEGERKELDVIIEDLKDYNPDNIQWLIKSSEEFCKKHAVWNALQDSMMIMDGLDKNRTEDSIPQLLTDALSVSFDTTIGHDYIEDFEVRFNSYHQNVTKLPFDIEMLNKITKGGLLPGTLTVFLAGCVHPETLVKLRISEKVFVCPIYQVEKFLQENDNVYVDSPDGWVRVKRYVDKGIFEEYILLLDDGKSVKCNKNHLFETPMGWLSSHDLYILDCEISFITVDGMVKGHIEKTGDNIPIVDIEVEHENHRYYTNGVSSHNTGVGKSMVMCHLAASYLAQSKNVLYITLEMSDVSVGERIDANLFDVDIGDLGSLEKSEFENKIMGLVKKSSGKLIIQEYATSTAHAGHFRHLISELKLKKKFVPDVIIIDYLNICASQRYKGNGTIGSYHYIKSISEEVRGLGMENKVPIISATQTNRCLALDTKVRIKGKGLINIKDVQVGDEIFTSGNNYHKVVQVYPIEEQECWEITAGSNKIVCSINHMFPVIGYPNFLSINVGLTTSLQLICKEYDSKGCLVETIQDISSIKKVGVRKTIDISIDGDHLFYANNILTHNSGYANSDPGMEDTSESFGLNFTADLTIALISSQEMESMGQIMFKQIKNRYNDTNYYNKFIVGLDRSRMRLFDCESTASAEISRDRQEKTSEKIFTDLTRKNKDRYAKLKV